MQNIKDLQRTQKCFVKLLLKNKCTTYEEALLKLNLQSLEERRSDLNLKFARHCTKSGKFQDLFPENGNFTRHKEKYTVPHCNTNRMKQSSLIQMKHLLNNEFQMGGLSQYILARQLIVVICFIFGLLHRWYNKPFSLSLSLSLSDARH